MPKNVQKQCYRSATGKRKPKCRDKGKQLCELCQQASDLHKKLTMTKLAARKLTNCHAAMISRYRKDERSSDIVAENIALQDEQMNQNKILESLENDKRNIMNNITIKEQEIDFRRAQIASELTIELMGYPRGTLDYLHNHIAMSIHPWKSHDIANLHEVSQHATSLHTPTKTS